jgi:hypothetical protein
MPPRSRQVAQPSLHGTSIDAAAAAPRRSRRPRRARTLAHAVDHGEGETFDLDDVSGNDDDDDDDDENDDIGDNDDDYNPANDPDPADPTNRPHRREVATTSQLANAGVNDPDLLQPKANTAADIQRFFEKVDNKIVCVECR